MSYPYCYLGPWRHLDPLKSGLTMKKHRKIQKILSQMLLLAAILARRRQPVASIVALDPLHWAMHLVSYWRIAMASKMTSKYSAFFVIFFLFVSPLFAGAIRLEYSPDDGIQWLWVKPWTPSIGRCACYCTGTSVWPSKWVALEVHSFIIDDFAINLIVAY